MKPLAPDYKRALYWALGLHLGIVVMMLLEIDFPWQNESHLSLMRYKMQK